MLMAPAYPTGDVAADFHILQTVQLLLHALPCGALTS